MWARIRYLRLRIGCRKRSGPRTSNERIVMFFLRLLPARYYFRHNKSLLMVRGRNAFKTIS